VSCGVLVSNIVGEFMVGSLADVAGPVTVSRERGGETNVSVSEESAYEELVSDEASEYDVVGELGELPEKLPRSCPRGCLERLTESI
jgi:hypothetical protein